MNVTSEDRRRLAAVVADRNAPQKHVWRAKIILATADGCGTFEVMRRSGCSKPVVWRWQERFIARKRAKEEYLPLLSEPKKAAARDDATMIRPVA